MKAARSSLSSIVLDYSDRKRVISEYRMSNKTPHTKKKVLFGPSFLVIPVLTISRAGRLLAWFIFPLLLCTAVLFRMLCHMISS